MYDTSSSCCPSYFFVWVDAPAWTTAAAAAAATAICLLTEIEITVL